MNLQGQVGQGAFGKVCKGRRKFSGQIVALKFIKKGGKSDDEIEQIRGEIAIMRQLNHENIIRMLDNFETDDKFVIVTEFAHVSLHYLQ